VDLILIIRLSRRWPLACWVLFDRIGLDSPDHLLKAGLVICHIPFRSLERYFILLGVTPYPRP
jgi:hypothetical protein